jgi:predicted transcriptional regulator
MPKIKSEILRILLDKDMITAEIADRLGYGKRKNKYDIVDRPLKELVNEGFIERSKVRVGKGRPPALYSFKRDIATILKVYERFPDVRDHLRKSDWVRRLVAGRFGKVGTEIDEMLKLSPSFFELAIKVESIGKLASLWYAYVKNPFVEKIEMEPFPEAFRLLFAFCVFLDEVGNKANPDAFELLKKFANESLQYNSEVSMETLKDVVSTELMKALKRIAGLIRSGDASLQQLLWLLDEYERTEARLSKLRGDKRDQLVKQLDEIYNKIAIFLEVSILK